MFLLRLSRPAAPLALTFGLVLVSTADAQRRPDETNADYQRRTNEEARRSAERAAEMQRDANRPNERSSSGADAGVRSYIENLRNQAEQEKARKAGQDAAAARQLAEERTRAAQAAAERTARTTLVAERNRERLLQGFATSSRSMHVASDNGKAITALVYFCYWFPELAEKAQAWMPIDALNPGNRTEAALSALEKAFANGDMSAPWHAAMLEGERAWSDDGRLGLAWWSIVSTAFETEEAPDTWAMEQKRARNQPFDLVDVALSGERARWDARLKDPLAWQDLGRSRADSGFVRPASPRAPKVDFTKFAEIEKAALQGDVTLLALAAGLSGGFMEVGAGTPDRTAPLLARLREVHPGYGYLLTALWHRARLGYYSPATLEASLRAAAAAGGRPARLAAPLLQEIEKSEQELAASVALWTGNPNAFRQRRDAAGRLAWRYLSGERLERIDPALAKLRGDDLARAALGKAAALERVAVEQIEYESSFYQAHDFICLDMLERHAPTRLDLAPAALLSRADGRLPADEIRSALPPGVAQLYIDLMLFPGLGLSPVRMRDKGYAEAVRVAREKLAPHVAQHPALLLLAPGLAGSGAANDDERMRRGALTLAQAGLPVPRVWAEKVEVTRITDVTLFEAFGRLRPGAVHETIAGLLRDWLARHSDDTAAPNLQPLRQSLSRASVAGVIEREVTDFASSYAALFGGTAGAAPRERPVGRGASTEITRAAHLINATVGILNPAGKPLPDDHPSVAWVRAAAERGDRAAVLALGRRIQKIDPPRAWMYWFEAAKRGHDPAAREFLSDRNPLLAGPKGQAMLWELHAAGVATARGALIKAALELADQQLPKAWEAGEPGEPRPPEPPGNAALVLDAVEKLTAAGIASPAVLEKILGPMTWITPRHLGGLDRSNYRWIADRATRARVLRVAREHLRQAVLRPGHSDFAALGNFADAVRVVVVAEGPAPVLDDIEAALERTQKGMTPAQDATWKEGAARQWFNLGRALYQSGHPARALGCYRRCFALEPGTLALYAAWLEAAFAAQAKTEIAEVAGLVLGFKDEEIKGESLGLLTRVALGMAGPYGVPRNEARLRGVAALLEREIGFLPEALAPFAPPSTPPGVGAPEWVRRLNLLHRFLSDTDCPPEVVAQAWTLANAGLNQPVTSPVRSLLLPYEVIARLDAHHHHAAAKALVERINLSGTPEQRARQICGDWYAVEPSEAADRFVTRHKAGEPWALRALELWILDGKLSAQEVNASYLKLVPALRTPAVEGWLKAQSGP